MANTYENLSVDNLPGTDAEWQAWVQAIEAAILASGFLEVAPDTGQINPLTIARPALGAYAGYRIYRAKDSLAATKPLYAKVEFGNTGSGADRPIIRRTMGTGSNGSGTLTGVQTTAVASANASAGSGAAQIYGGGGPHAMFLYQKDAGSASHTIFWGCGRLLDQDDGSVADPLVWDTFSGASGILVMGAYQYTDGAIAWTNNASGIATHIPDLSVGINSGGNVGTTRLFQALVYRNGKSWAFPVLGGKSTELPLTTPASSKFSLNVWGGNHTFLPIDQSGYVSGSNRLCFLWE